MNITAQSKKTIVGSILLDRSGSMNSILPVLIKGLQTFIDETKGTATRAEECYFRLTTFSDYKDVYFPEKTNETTRFGNIENLNTEDLNFTTLGCTRLVDSAIEEANILQEKINELNDKIIMSWFVLLTDGIDNVSRKSHTILKEKIEKLKENNVNCIFMGANIDAIKTGDIYGFDVDKSIQFDTNTTENEEDAPLYQGFRSLSDNVTQTFNDESQDMSFSTLQRSVSAPTQFNPRSNENQSFQSSLPTLVRHVAEELDFDDDHVD